MAAHVCVCVLVRLQIASMGTFQVLKLPLGFIRVLEWVSCNFHVLFGVKQQLTGFGSTGDTGGGKFCAHVVSKQPGFGSIDVPATAT